jgi:hypothetical protein
VLSKESKCKVCEAAINPKIIELGIQQGGWSELKNLGNKQRMAVRLAVDVSCVLLINQCKFVVPAPCVEYWLEPAPPPPATKNSSSGPMDLDSILALTYFSFPVWRQECTNFSLCICCVKTFDIAHQEAKGCVLPDSKWLEKRDLLKIWKS